MLAGVHRELRASAWAPPHPCAGVPWAPWALSGPKRTLAVAVSSRHLCMCGSGLATRASKTMALVEAALRTCAAVPNASAPATINIHDASCNQSTFAFARFELRGRCRERLLPWWTFADGPEEGLVPNLTATIRALGEVARPAEAGCVWMGRTGADAQPDGAMPRGLFTPVRHLLARNAYDGLTVADTGGGRRGMDIVSQARQWSCFLDVRGAGFSQRVPVLMHTGRPLLYAERPGLVTWFEASDFEEPWRPWVHYVPVDPRLTNLEERIAWLRAHPRARIGEAARAYARRHFTVAAARRVVRDRLFGPDCAGRRTDGAV